MTRTQGFITAGALSLFLLCATQLHADPQKGPPEVVIDWGAELGPREPVEAIPETPPKRDPNSIASRNMRDVLKGLKAGKFKYKAESNPCISDAFCTVMVGHTQINAYGGGAVDIMTSSMVPDARYIVVCAAALAGLANIDPMTASSLFGEGLAKGRLKVGDVLLKTQTRQDGKVSCNLYRKPINPKG